MILRKTELPGAFVIEPERREDERGFFARTWCEREAAAAGLEPHVAQCSISYNKCAGTLRGMHFQREPWAEVRLVRCTQGAIYDVIVDLRPGSPTFKQHCAVGLNADNRLMLYIPKQFAHGFLTLADHTEVFYQMSEFYRAEHAGGWRWDDPAFGIRWPSKPRVISERDLDFPSFTG